MKKNPFYVGGSYKEIAEKINSEEAAAHLLKISGCLEEILVFLDKLITDFHHRMKVEPPRSLEFQGKEEMY